MANKQTKRPAGVITEGLKARIDTNNETARLPFPSHVSTQEDYEIVERGGDPLEDLPGDFKPDAHYDAATARHQANLDALEGQKGRYQPRDVHPQHHANRYAVTLNVGLVNNPWRHIPQAERLGLYSRLLRDTFASEGLSPMADTALLLATYKPCTATHRSEGQPSAFVTEDTDVITFDVYSKARLHGRALSEAVKRATFYTAFALHQEAVAAYYVDEGARDIADREEVLLLAGPDAYRWPAPDFAKFQKWDKSATHGAVRF